MRDALKNLFSNKITLEDNNLFYYTITAYELTNTLGYVVAVLQEYNFSKSGNKNEQFSCKLYKTKEGNWYDIENVISIEQKTIFRMLKSAIDRKEIASVSE